MQVVFIPDFFIPDIFKPDVCTKYKLSLFQISFNKFL